MAAFFNFDTPLNDPSLSRTALSILMGLPVPSVLLNQGCLMASPAESLALGFTTSSFLIRSMTLSVQS